MNRPKQRLGLTVHLRDLDDEGQSFKYEPGEEKKLDETLYELFDGDKKYVIEFTVRPVGEIYLVEGQLESEYKGQCSLCAEEIDTMTKGRISEYLVQKTKRDAPGHSPHTGLDYENEKNTTFFESHDYELTDFIREQFAISLPEYPKCEDTKACEIRQAENQKRMIESGVSMDGHPAFQVLKKD